MFTNSCKTSKLISCFPFFFRSQAFIALRTQLIGSQSELDATRKRAAEFQTQISDTDRELLAAKARVSAAEKGGVEAIDELKSTDKLISESLKAELDRLREDYNFAVSERDAQKSQLIEALLAKDKLRKEVEDTKELQESSTAGPPDTDVSDAMKKSTEKIEKLRTRLKERKLVSFRIYFRPYSLVQSSAFQTYHPSCEHSVSTFQMTTSRFSQGTLFLQSSHSPIQFAMDVKRKMAVLQRFEVAIEAAEVKRA